LEELKAGLESKIGKIDPEIECYKLVAGPGAQL
jgi:hypothetical protein